MPTSARNRRAERGLTLVELLIVLAILAFTASLAGAGFAAASPRLVLNQAANQLVADLKAARLHAAQTGAGVAVTPTEAGYAIASLGITRRLPRGVAAEWRTDIAGGVVFSRRFANLGARIDLTSGQRRAGVLVRPITGKIERVE